MKKPTISDFRKAASDPKTMEIIRKHVPQFSHMPDEEAAKIAANAESHLAEFQDKFGDLNTEEIMDLNRLHYKDLESYPLSEFTAEMNQIKDTDTINLMQILNIGDGLVTTKKIGFSNGIRYVYARRNSMLYIFSMKDTTSNKVVLTLASVSPFTKDVIAKISIPVIREYDKVFRVPERLITAAEKIVCVNPSDSSHEWRRLSKDIEKEFENAFEHDPKSILYMEVEPMQK